MDLRRGPCLYNVSADAAERHNIAHQYPEVVARLRAELFSARCPACDVDYSDEPACALTTCEALEKHGTFWPHCAKNATRAPPVQPSVPLYKCADHKCVPSPHAHFNTSSCRGLERAPPDGCGAAG